MCQAGTEQGEEGGPNSRKLSITSNPKFSSLGVTERPRLQDNVHTPIFFPAVNSKTFYEQSGEYG